MEFIDLGLPSGNLWANCNIGAEKEEEIGLYFVWGETKGYKLEETKFVKDNVFSIFDKYTEKDGLEELDNKDDASFVLIGEQCKTPTYFDFSELLEHTEHKYDEERKGIILKSKENGNSIFLPFNGHSIGHFIVSLDKCGDYMCSHLLGTNDKIIEDTIVILTIFLTDENKEICGLKPDPRHEFHCIRPIKIIEKNINNNNNK